MVLEEKGNIEQQNRRESPEINSCNFGQLTYDKRGKATTMEKRQSLQ